MYDSGLRTNTSSEDIVFVGVVFEFEDEMLVRLVVVRVTDYIPPGLPS